MQATNGSAGRGQARSRAGINTDQVERVASTVLGGTALLLGLKQRSIGGTLIGLAGGVLLYRGISGRPHVLQRLGMGDGQSTEPEDGAPSDATDVRKWITIGRPAEELYRLWREPETLPRAMAHVAEVRVAGPDRAHWTVHAPLGRRLEWESRTVEDRPSEELSWRSTEGASMPNEGGVTFRPAPRGLGTEVTLHLRFEPPGGALGGAVVKLLPLIAGLPMNGGVAMTPGLMASTALRRFKSLAETGEIPTLEHNPTARAG